MAGKDLRERRTQTATTLSATASTPDAFTLLAAALPYARKLANQFVATRCQEDAQQVNSKRLLFFFIKKRDKKKINNSLCFISVIA